MSLFLPITAPANSSPFLHVSLEVCWISWDCIVRVGPPFWSCRQPYNTLQRSPPPNIWVSFVNWWCLCVCRHWFFVLFCFYLPFFKVLIFSCKPRGSSRFAKNIWPHWASSVCMVEIAWKLDSWYGWGKAFVEKNWMGQGFSNPTSVCFCNFGVLTLALQEEHMDWNCAFHIKSSSSFMSLSCCMWIGVHWGTHWQAWLATWEPLFPKTFPSR